MVWYFISVYIIDKTLHDRALTREVFLLIRDLLVNLYFKEFMGEKTFFGKVW